MINFNRFLILTQQL